ncbi:MAG: FtsW/RodA/SpoVE family cell cycle protein [Chloroflexi bacterium]|nr:FtsW/RodA/SpoVE family cell cycle protein [Chloroflexota bacterium]
MASIISDRRPETGDRYEAGLRSPVSGRVLFWLAFLFTGLALTQLALANNDLEPATFLPLPIFFLCGAVSAYLFQRQGKVGDPILLPLVFFLSGLGLAMIARLAPAFVNPQLAWLVAATLVLLLITLIPHNLNWLRRYKYAWLTGGLILLAATLLFGVNPSGFGPRLWLPVGPVYFQPSEPLKLLLVIFLAAYLADRRRQLIEVKAYIGPVGMPHPSYWGPMLLMWGLSIVLLVWQRDLGAALLFFCTFLAMLYAAIGQKRYLWAGALLLVGAGSIGYILFDVVRLRFEAFWNPWLDPAGRSFQIVQSLLAFASGGLFGQGLGQGLPTAIPVVHTDFVFAAIGEEYGLLGALGVLVCFVMLVSRAFYIALRAQTGFEQLLSAGIGAILSLQTIIITAGTLKLMPLTGVTLPFVSYGGSSLVTSFAMVGLLLFIANQRIKQEVKGQKNEATGYASRSSAKPLLGTLHASRSSAKPPLGTFHAPLPIHHLNLARGLFTGFSIVAGGLIFWQIALASFLTPRDDNPRPVVAEQQIRRGRLLTADGISVAETIINEQGLAERRYPYAGLSSVTGYYSIRYGVGGTESAFDPILRGTAGKTTAEKWLDDLLHRPLVGRDVTLTIDLPAQVAADVALGGQEGAVVVMEIETGAILVMSSHPTYDPNKLDADWDVLRQDQRAPLLNRATQGLFPVGDLARLIGLIGLREAGTTLPADPMTAPLAEMLAPLSQPGYLATARQLGLIRPLPGLPSQVGRLPDFEDRGTVRDLAVTPLHLARVVAALELEGRLPTPALAQAEADPAARQTQAFGPDTAEYIRSLLPQVNDQIVGLIGEATPKETGQRSLSWFVGLAPAKVEKAKAEAETKLILDPSQITAPTPKVQAERVPARYVVVAVVVTDEPESNPALRIARAPLKVILER